MSEAVGETSQTLWCNTKTWQPWTSALPPASASSLLQWFCCRIPGGSKLRKPNLCPISSWSVLLWNMLFSGSVQNFLDLATHTTIVYFYCWGLFVFLLQVKVLRKSWKCFIEGYLLQCTAIAWSSIHRRKIQMYKLCRQKSMRFLRGNSLAVVWSCGW